MLWKGVILLGSILALVACASGAAPTPTATNAPAAAPTRAAEPSKAPAPSPTAPPAPTATPKPVTLQYGSTRSAAEAAVYIAIEKGFFKEQGIDIAVNPFNTSAEMVAPLGTGKLDLAQSPVGPALLAAADRGIDFKIVAGASVARPKWENNWVVLRKDHSDSGKVKTPADLKGMTIAIPFKGSIGDQVIQMMIQEAGLKPEDVKIETLVFAQQAVAFANKGIDAGFVSEPTTAQIVQQGLVVKWIPISKFFGGEFTGHALIFGSGLGKDKELGQRLMTAYVKGIRAYLDAFGKNVGREEAVNILIKYTPLKDPKLYDLMEAPYQDPDGGVDLRSLNQHYQWFVREGLYTGKKTFEDIIDRSFAEYASKQLGKYQ